MNEIKRLTQKEVEDSKQKLKAQCDRLMLARDAILADLKARYFANDKSVKVQDPETKHRWYEPQKNYFTGQGETACPVCKTGRLQYRRSAYNGHVHGCCSTDDCVAWME